MKPAMRSRGTRDPTDAARRERGIRTRRSASLPDERLWYNDRRISKDSRRNDGGNAIKNVGEYTGPLSALSRSKIEKAANNEMRTELLKALGTAFGVKGMTVQDGKKAYESAVAMLESLSGGG